MRGTHVVLAAVAACLAVPAGAQAAPPPLAPLDAQNPRWADDTTWSDYQPLPGSDYSDPTIRPTVKKWRVALVMVDFPDRDFTVSQPVGSTIYGMPTAEAHDIPRAQVPQFYADFLNKPQPLNHFQTMNRYWMEDTYGKYGVELVPFGPYRMPFKAFQYFQQQFGSSRFCPTPAVTPCNKDFRGDARAAWLADQGQEILSQFDNIFYVAAGEDQSSTWQEFGEMKWLAREQVPEAFGPHAYDQTLPNWGDTRYVPWTSWAASTNIWPNAVISGPPPLNSIEGESSGMSTYAHELTHNLGILDNYNNPYAVPPQRSATGNWDMMSRGTFNGPGGPHTRYHIPPTLGASLGSQHNVRNKHKLGFLSNDQVLQLNRDALAQTGMVVADVTAREWDPGSGLAGLRVTLDGNGDRTPSCDYRVDWRCDGTGTSANSKYQMYMLEAVQQIGSDSFVPAHGVLISKLKSAEGRSCGSFSCYVWMIDANPQDVNHVDFVRPDGTSAMATVGDPRQLNDAAFNVGLGSGSKYEWEDTPNRLHFYIVDVRKDANGILHYKVAVKSLDGAGAQARGVAFAATPAVASDQDGWTTCTFRLQNTGAAAATPPAGHISDATAYLGADVYRLSASTTAPGWTAQLRNELASAKFGETVSVPVYVAREAGAATSGSVSLTAKSESDPSKTATAECALADEQVGGDVPATLSLTLGGPISLGTFTPGVAKDYTAQTTANVISTAGEATLSVSDPGHLANGAFTLPQPLQVLGVPKTYEGPVSNDPVTIGFKQSIGAGDALRTGSYTRTLTFTLSTTKP